MMGEDSIVSDIEFARRLIEEVLKGQTSPKSDLNIDVSIAINNTTSMLKAITSIKTQLCRLPLDFCEIEYINNYVNPLINTVFYLALTSFELSFSIFVLTFSPIVSAKKSKLKDTINLMYDINEECEEIYKMLKKRLETLLRCPSHTSVKNTFDR